MVISLLFSGTGLYFILTDNAPLTLWLAFLFFSICSIIFILQLVPGSSYLKINAEGIETVTLFRKSFIPWNAIKEMGVLRMNMQTMIGINFSPKYIKAEKGKMLSRNLSGWEGALPSTYGMKADKLVELLYAYKKNAK